MARKRGSESVTLLLELIDQSFDTVAWHGVNLRGSIKGVKLTEALWRPGAKRHNIWENVLHAAYWKYAAWRRITGAPKGSFARKPSDWPRMPEVTNAATWKQDIALLESEHARLREAVAGFAGSRLSAKLDATPQGSKVKFVQLIYGIASHDVYHAGQIQLLKRLVRSG